MLTSICNTDGMISAPSIMYVSSSCEPFQVVSTSRMEVVTFDYLQSMKRVSYQSKYIPDYALVPTHTQQTPPCFKVTLDPVQVWTMQNQLEATQHLPMQ